jgi:hypothetical protein
MSRMAYPRVMRTDANVGQIGGAASKAFRPHTPRPSPGPRFNNGFARLVVPFDDARMLARTKHYRSVMPRRSRELTIT